MNVGLNSSLNGEYTIYDENMVEIASTSNLITDWGMRRFLGDTSTGAPNMEVTDLPSRAFCYNISNLFVGAGSTPVSVTDWKLESRVLPISAETVPTQTGTTSMLASDGDLVIIYTHLQKLTFAENLSASVEIREVGANWTTIEAQNNRYGIFSRAVLPSTGNNSYVTIAANRPRRQVIFLKYNLYFKTNCNKVLTSMPHLTGTGATPFPANKTNVRRFPLYVMDTLAKPVQELNFAATDDGNEYVQPIFENMSLDNHEYVGTGVWQTTNNPNQWSTTTVGDELRWQSNLLGSSVSVRNARKVWWLQYYTEDFINPTNYTELLINGGQNPRLRYDNFVSTTSYKYNNSSTIRVFRNDAIVTSIVNAQVMYANNSSFDFNSNAGRVPHDFTELTRNNNTWNRKIQFFFTPNILKPKTTVLKLYPATLGNWNNANSSNYWGSVYVDNNGYHDYGVVTALSASYSPNPAHYLGFEYNFSFTRGLSSFQQSGNSQLLSGFRTPDIYYDPNNPNSFNPTSTTLSATLFNLGTLSAVPALTGQIVRADVGHTTVDTPNGQRVFDFTNTNFIINFPQAFDFGIRPITANFWISLQQTLLNNHRVLLSNTTGYNAAPSTGFSMQIYNSETLFFQKPVTGSGNYQNGSNAVHQEGFMDSNTKWYMVTYVYEPANKNLWTYVNGQLLIGNYITDTRSSFTAYTQSSPPPVNVWRIGGEANHNNTAYYFRGEMGEIEIFLDYIPDPLTVYREFENSKARYNAI